MLIVGRLTCWMGVVKDCLGITRMAGFCKANRIFDLAAWAFDQANKWLLNLRLAGNPITRIPDFVQPWGAGPNFIFLPNFLFILVRSPFKNLNSYDNPLWGFE